MCSLLIDNTKIIVKSNSLNVQKTLESTYMESDHIRKSQREQNVSAKSKEREYWGGFFLFFFWQKLIEKIKEMCGFHCRYYLMITTEE